MSSITDALNTGRGDYGVYNGDTGIATLIGNVVIQRGKNVIQGQRGVMDLNNNVSPHDAGRRSRRGQAARPGPVRPRSGASPAPRRAGDRKHAVMRPTTPEAADRQ